MDLEIGFFSENEISSETERVILHKFDMNFPNSKIHVFKYNKVEFDMRFNELCYMIRDLVIYENDFELMLHRLINIFEEIYTEMPSLDCDIIGANDGLSGFEDRYQDNWNDFDKFGLFITKRDVQIKKLYYQSDILKFQVNTEFCSFNIFFNTVFEPKQGWKQ